MYSNDSRLLKILRNNKVNYWTQQETQVCCIRSARLQIINKYRYRYLPNACILSWSCPGSASQIFSLYRAKRFWSHSYLKLPCVNRRTTQTHIWNFRSRQSEESSGSSRQIHLVCLRIGLFDTYWRGDCFLSPRTIQLHRVGDSERLVSLSH